jgi:tetratricopeptide (TPR) repeat protein
LGTAYRQLGELEQAALRYRQALEQCEAVGDLLMVSRAYHALAGLHWRRDEIELALEQMERAAETSRGIGYGPGIAHGLVALGHIHAQAGRPERAREHWQDAVSWLRLTEDESGLAEIQALLGALEQGTPMQVSLLPAEISWVKGHVALAEGKVYCAFESPVAQCAPPAGLDGG